MRSALIILAALVAGAGSAAAQDNVPAEFDPGAHAPGLGAREAPVVVVEFFDFRCEYCARQARGVFPGIRERFIDTGRVRYAWVEALPSGDADAERDAVAARCAGASGRYPEARDYLYAEAPGAREGSLDLGAFAAALDLEPGALVFCVETRRFAPEVRDATLRARAHRVTATPTYFFGYPVEGGTAMTVERHVVGEITLEQFGALVERLEESRRDARPGQRVER